MQTTKDTKNWPNLIRKHQEGKHSETCRIWDFDYKGYICKYSWEPYGETAVSIYGQRAFMKKDGRTQSPFYATWTNMKTRCYNLKGTGFKDYGGRGITVCDRWLNDVSNFIKDMAPTYFDGATLDRIDVNGNYELSNCRWATWDEQQNNRRSNRLLKNGNRELTVAQWSKELGIRSTTIRQRLDSYGWSVEKTLNTSTRERRI